MEQKLLEILSEICEEDVVKTEPDINIVEAGLIDSMGYMELLVAIEEEFGVYIAPTELERKDMDTPNKIISQVRLRI